MKIKNNFTKLTLSEVETQMSVLTEKEMTQLKGGGDGSYHNPYTVDDFNLLIDYGVFIGGYVEGMGYVNALEPVTVVGPSKKNPGWGSEFSYYKPWENQNLGESNNEPIYGPEQYVGGGGAIHKTEPISHKKEDDRDIFLKKIFGNTSFSVSDRDWGAIGSNTFNNPYSANGATIHRITTNSNMNINLSPVLNQEGNYSIGNLQGVNINITISGDAIAPYPGVDIRLSPIKMIVNSQEVRATSFQNPQFLQGGSVPSIPFEIFMDSTSLREIASTSGRMLLEFEGIYVDKNGNTIMCDPVTNTFPNRINLIIEIPVYQF